MGIAAGIVLGAAIATVVLIYAAGGIVEAADRHPGLAGWVQAVGATAAVGVAIWISSREARSARKAKVEEHNALVDLCVGLGEIARAETQKRLL